MSARRPLRRLRGLAMLAMLAALALAGPIACGKRGTLEPPPGQPSTFPQPYPAN